MISAIFEQFVEVTPVSVMVRGIMERIFEPKTLDDLFERHATSQYTREVLFSSIVRLMSLVVSGILHQLMLHIKHWKKQWEFRVQNYTGS